MGEGALARPRLIKANTPRKIMSFYETGHGNYRWLRNLQGSYSRNHDGYGMNTEDKLKRIFAVLLKAAQKDPKALANIEQIFNESSVAISGEPSRPPRPKNRRNAAPFYPFLVYQEGDGMLLKRLRELDIEALRDMLAEFGMDPAKLAMKWKSTERIVEHILSTVQSRLPRGDAFRT
jgi:hypothetical protein